MREDFRDCDTCRHNHGAYCTGEACKDGDGYEPDLPPPKYCRCSGRLSEIRIHNGRKYRHCYSCHFEFFEEETV